MVSMAAGARLVILAIKVARVPMDLQERQGLLEMWENLEKAYLVLMEQMEKTVSRGGKVGFIIMRTECRLHPYREIKFRGT